MKSAFVKKTILNLLVLMLFGLGLNAQTVVKGKVTDMDTKEELIGVNISVKGTTSGTTTDFEGNYTLSTTEATPFKLVFSYVGYENQEFDVTGSITLDVILSTGAIMANEVVISASRVEEKILESPVTIEKLDPQAIKASSSADYYDEISKLKGVQTVQGSLTLTSVNTRGFGAIANERMVQLMDGMDNAAPLLNFPTGNVVGIGELDIHNVELVPGAASALYGPNAFNGILLMNSKNPFDYQGFSAQVKGGATISDGNGRNPYGQVSVRYARSIKDKLAFKVNFSYLKGTDWAANNYTDGRQTAAVSNPSGPGAPNFDGLNTYGDETRIFVPFANPAVYNNLVAQFYPRLESLGIEITQDEFRDAIISLPALDIRRTGYREEDLLDNSDATSLKADGAIHYRPMKNMEISYAYRYGTGNTIYQGGERYVLRGFSQQYHKVEMKGAEYFLRAYLSKTDAGDSYNLTALGALVNEAQAPSSAAWAPAYIAGYAISALAPSGFLGQAQYSAEALAAAHALGRDVANGNDGNLLATVVRGLIEYDRKVLNPYTQDLTNKEKASLQEIIEGVRANKFKKTPPGASFTDDSRLMHVEGNYNFSKLVKVLDIMVGANWRQYDLFSDGTIFNEDPNVTGTNSRIKINEYGAYLQASKSFLGDTKDRLKLTASIRFDKNNNLKQVWSPRVSAVYSAGPRRQHNIRASWQTGFRNPSTQNLFILFPLGTTTLVGSSEKNAAALGLHNGGAYTVSSYTQYQGALLQGASLEQARALLVVDDFDYVKPEKLTAFEVGYKSTPHRKVFLDVSAYLNIYDDFIAQREVILRNSATFVGVNYNGVDDSPNGTGAQFRPYINASERIYSWGVGFSGRYKLPKDFELYGNYQYTDFTVSDQQGDFEAGFNTPMNMFTLGVNYMNKNRVKGFGFDLNYRWQQEFFWENSFAFGDIPSFGVMNAQFSYQIPKAMSVVKVGGQNILQPAMGDYITNAGGPGIGALWYVSWTFDQALKAKK